MSPSLVSWSHRIASWSTSSPSAIVPRWILIYRWPHQRLVRFVETQVVYVPQRFMEENKSPTRSCAYTNPLLRVEFRWYNCADTVLKLIDSPHSLFKRLLPLPCHSSHPVLYAYREGSHYMVSTALRRQP